MAAIGRVTGNTVHFRKLRFSQTGAHAKKLGRTP